MDINVYSARLKARQDQLNHEKKRKLAHERVAIMLKDKRNAPELVQYAISQVAKWRANGLCSLDYIEDWSRLLQQPNKAAELLLEDSQRAMRLRQNSPFAAYLSM